MHDEMLCNRRYQDREVQLQPRNRVQKQRNIEKKCNPSQAHLTLNNFILASSLTEEHLRN
jgi:hypothetical protein